LRTDALAWMRQPAGAPRFHLVFLDPPFGRDWQAPALELASHLLAPGAWVYVESPAQCSTGPAGLELHRHLQAGAVHAHLFKAPAP